MNKKLIVPFLFLVIIFGCSSSKDVSNLPAEERLNYAIKLYNDGDYQQAATQFEAITLQYPGSDIIDDAQFYLAQSRFKRKEYILAASEFSRLIQNIPASPFVPDAQFMLSKCYYKLSPNYTLDQRFTQKAVEEYQAFIDFFPSDPRVPEAEKKIKELNEKLAKKIYNSAQIYEKMEYFNASILYYTQIVETYHDTPYAPKASYQKIKLLIQKQRTNEALDEINNFLVRYPQDSNLSEVKKLKESLDSLNKVKTTSDAAHR